MKFIGPKLHGALDYAVAVALIAVPLLFDFAATSAAALWIAVAGGGALFVYSLFTDYSAGVRAVIPFRVHLKLDAIAGAALLAAPYLFAFAGTARLFYLVVGAADLVVVLCSRTDEREAPASAAAVASTAG